MRGLVVMPHVRSLPGTLGEEAERRGAQLVRVVPSRGEPLPALDGFDFVMAMGSPWSVYSEEVQPWIHQELRLMRDAVELGVPVFGVCFGAQAFARALGGRVYPAHRTELGWETVETADPDLIPGGPWFMWHSDTFDLPGGARLVAWTDTGPQVFTHGPHLLVQFHPEVKAEIAESWNPRDFERAGLSREAVLEETRLRAGESRERAGHLLDRFLSGVRQRG